MLHPSSLTRAFLFSGLYLNKPISITFCTQVHLFMTVLIHVILRACFKDWNLSFVLLIEIACLTSRSCCLHEVHCWGYYLKFRIKSVLLNLYFLFSDQNIKSADTAKNNIGSLCFKQSPQLLPLAGHLHCTAFHHVHPHEAPGGAAEHPRNTNLIHFQSSIQGNQIKNRLVIFLNDCLSLNILK